MVPITLQVLINTSQSLLSAFLLLNINCFLQSDLTYNHSTKPLNHKWAEQAQ